MQNTIAIAGFSAILIAVACNMDPIPTNNSSQAPATEQQTSPEPLVEEVLTKDQRDAMTPDQVLELFKEGNNRFNNNDLFVGRVAGNFVNEDLLGSMEFGCKVAGSKLILVMGHEHCGAVKAAIDDVKLGNITAMLSKIRPAVDLVEYEGDRSSSNAEFVHKVCESNVRNTLEQIRANSEILNEMEQAGEIKMVGAVYDMDSGKVEFLDQ